MKLLKQNTTMRIMVQDMPELRYTPTGHAVCTFNAFHLPDERILRCEAWDHLGELIVDADYLPQQYAKITGSFRVRKYTTMNNEEKEYEFFAITAMERQS